MQAGPDKAIDMWRAAQRLPCASPHPLIGMSDALRLNDLPGATSRLPRGSLLIIRTVTPLPAAKIRNLQRKARAKGVRLYLSSPQQGPQFQITDGRHLPERACFHHYTDNVPLSAAAHGHRAIIAAARAGASLVLISPVFQTPSHPGAPTLGIARLARLARDAKALGLMPYALGGVTTPHHINRLRDTGISGIAGVRFLQA